MGGDTPDAGPGGQSYRSWIATLSLLRDITRNSSLRLGAGRGPELSSFEDNGFYVSNFVDATLVFQLPLQLAAQAGVGYRVNDYQVVASGLQEPRQDTILGWSGGLGRPLTNWAYVRVDYRADRRDSNVKEFDGLKTYTFLAQIGIGIFKGRQP